MIGSINYLKYFLFNLKPGQFILCPMKTRYFT